MERDNTLDLLSHHPQRLEGDALNFEHYARTIYEILEGLTYDRTGLTIGIYGDWGTGKSTLLTMTGELLDEKSKLKPFLAWHCKRLRAFFHCLWLLFLSTICPDGTLSPTVFKLWLLLTGKWSEQGARLHDICPKGSRFRTLFWLWHRTLGRWSKRGKTIYAIWLLYSKVKPEHYRPLVVRFEAWKYSNEQIWAAMLRTIVEAIYDQHWLGSIFWDRLRLWRRRIKPEQMLKFSARFLLAFAILWGGVKLIRAWGAKADWLPSTYDWIVKQLNLSSILPLSDATPTPTPTSTAIPVFNITPIATATLVLTATPVRTIAPGTGSTPSPSVTPDANIPLFTDKLMPALGRDTPIAASWALLLTLAKGIIQGVMWAMRVRFKLPKHLTRATLDKEALPDNERFRHELEDLMRVVGWRRPIVVLVDDLDRAPMEKIVPILEATKHFSIRPDPTFCKEPEKRRAPIAFVFAADRDAIQCAIASYYEDAWKAAPNAIDATSFTREYLEKIVQINFELPPLPSSRLEKLLPRQQELEALSQDTVRSLPAALWAAREMFVRSYTGNPRHVIQAYNSFQVVWRIIQRRNLTQIDDPRLLAALILIRYLWPRTFKQICMYPELFFGLHAIARSEPNRECGRSELEELLSLGCPSTAPPAILEEIRRKQVELFHLLQPVVLPKYLDPKQLERYLTLVPELSAEPDFQRIELSTALLSGNPCMIKYALRTDQKGVKERILWLFEFIEPKQNGTLSEKEEAEKEQRMVLALFALGRLKEPRAVEPIAQVIERQKDYSPAVVARAIYALAHLAEQNRDRLRAHRTLATLIENEKTSRALQVRILRLLEPSHDGALDIAAELRQAIVRLALRGSIQYVRDRAIEFVRQRWWLECVYDEFGRQEYAATSTTSSERDRQNADDERSHQARASVPGELDRYLDIVEQCLNPPSESSGQEYQGRTDLEPEPQLQPLPARVQEHLVRLASEARSLHQGQALGILYKLTDASESVRAMAQVVAKSAPSADIDDTIEMIGERQAQAEHWQIKAWEAVEEQLKEREELARQAKQQVSIPWDRMAVALRQTDHWAALPLLEQLTHHLDQQVKRVAIDNLEKMLLQPSKMLQSRAISPEALSVLQGLLEHQDEGIR